MHPTPTLLLLFLLNLHLSTSFLPPPSLSLPSLHLHRASSSLPGRKPKRDPISNIDDVIDWFDSSSDLDDVKNSMNLMRKAYEGGKEEEFEEWKSASAQPQPTSPKTWSYDDTNDNNPPLRQNKANKNSNRQGTRQSFTNPNSPSPNSADSIKILQEFDFAQVKTRSKPSQQQPPPTFDADDLFSSNDESASDDDTNTSANPPPISSDTLSYLNKAQVTAFRSQLPRALEGYTSTLVSSVDVSSLMNLRGVFGSYGCEVIQNFADFLVPQYDNEITIEQLAEEKARLIYEKMGLPVVTSQTSVRIESAEPKEYEEAELMGLSKEEMKRINTERSAPPRALAEYRFNDLSPSINNLVQILSQFSSPSRMVEFSTVVCYYDGEMTLFDYGTVEVDLKFFKLERAYISNSHAISGIGKTLAALNEWSYQGWLETAKESINDNKFTGASKLRSRVLKDARVLPNDIIDVSKFMDSQVDVSLMDECAEELASRYTDLKPTKVLTVATTGLVIAIPICRYLSVPCVYARKQRNVVMAEAYHAAYSSKTVGANRELLVSKSHLDAEDRVLIVDDFLSSGSSQEALLRIVSDAGAQVIGVAVLVEKQYDRGRKSLSGYNVKVESLVSVKNVKEGTITLEGEGDNEERGGVGGE
ncbi:hypothetical protein TrLO_g8621 [Triparma laevis f. longispina]|uniref:Phosphoribosyltransferase domain-containing protein n=1 Tax=Triparma laevis f. longispina TaxID=1714387 RepID=A0A9W7AYI6_9STRA|nr:hypothetical protein TrLO_g8621 [Triparma laevis f. longispina]